MAWLDAETLQRVRRTQQMRETAAVQADPMTAALLADYQNRYWWMNPMAKWSLARSGLPAGSDTALVAAQAAAHIEVNKGLSFAPIGSPVLSTSGPVELSDVFNALEARRTARLVRPAAPAAPEPAAVVAAGEGPLKQLGRDYAPDTWYGLPNTVQAELNAVQIIEADEGAVPRAGADPTPVTFDHNTYRIAGADHLSPDARAAFFKVLAGLGVRTEIYGPWRAENAATAELDAGGTSTQYGPWAQQGDNLLLLAKEVVPDAHASDPGFLGTNVLAYPLPSVAGAFRVATSVLNAPLQELQGQVRNVYEAAVTHDNPNWLQSQSDLGIAIGDIAAGRDVDMGSGLFVDPESKVAQERVRRELQRGNIGGEGITVGRVAASLPIGTVADFAAPGLKTFLPESVRDASVTEPGSKPYQLLSGLVDLAVAVKADPSAIALKRTAAAGRAANMFVEPGPGAASQGITAFRETGRVTEAFRAFQDAGGLTGIRPTVSGEAVNTWLTAPDTRPILDKLVEGDDTYSIYKAFGGKIDPSVAAQLADAKHTEHVADLLRSQLGVYVKEKPSLRDVSGRAGVRRMLPGFDGAPVIKRSPPSRWVAMMPDEVVDGTDLAANAMQLERAAAVLKAPPERFHGWFDAMARTSTPMERDAVWQTVMDDTAEDLVGRGIGAERARTLTRMRQGDDALARTYAVQAVADGAGSFDQQLVVNGKPAFIVDNQPTMLAQTLDGPIPLPDWRELRRALAPKPVRAILENEGIQGAERLLMSGQLVWKRVQIMTMKTMFKIVADEQAQIAGRGFESMFSHPISALSIILATPLSELPEDAKFIARLQHATSKTVRWAAEDVLNMEPHIVTTATGEDFDRLAELQHVASHGFDTSIDTRGVLHANDWKVLDYRPGVNDAEFAKAHARHLAQYAASPETRGFARAESLTAAQDSYWDGELARYRLQFAKNGRNGRPELLDRAGSDAYVAKMFKQMQAVTNGNPELMNAVATGKLDGAAIWTTVRDGSPQVSKNFVAKLEGYSDDFPKVTPQQKAIYSTAEARRQVVDGVFDRWLQALLGTPSAVLSKSPLFRQAYWDRIIDNATFMTGDAQTEALRIAQAEANVGPKIVRDLRATIARGTGELDLEQADTIAKGHALDIVQRTTDEFSNRSQVFDMLRLLTPFGEVWRKTITRWATVINENPAVIRRAQQVWQAAHGTDAGKLFGAPAGQGFFHTSTQTGEEVFSIPGSEWATQALTGVPVPLVGNVQGLSLGTDIFPGFGPVASIPVAWTMEKLHLMNQDTPGGTIGSIIFPYGPPKGWADIYTYAPSWVQKALGADRPTSQDSVRTFDNAVKDVIQYGATNGDYDLSTPAGIQHAMEDAEGKARTLYFIRGAAQWVIPGAPSPEWLVRDKTGRLVDATALVQEYRSLQNDDPNTAGGIFLDRYGPDVFKTTTTPRSYSYVFGLPTSPKSVKWVGDHPELKRDLPHIYGYFAPPSDPEDFDYDAYLDQLEPGQGRAALSPEQWVKVANGRLAALEYGRLRDKVTEQNNGIEPDAGQRAWLARKKLELIDRYPGYAETLYGGAGLPDRPDPKLLVLEAQTAAEDPMVRKTDAGKGLVSFLAKRAQVEASWAEAGYAVGSWATANNADGLAMRDWLRSKAAQITGQHAQFGPLFESVFEREMRDDTDPNNLVGSAPAIGS